nr:hypothetical protein BaRGS_030204 [Batillaria attramentaria]
MFPAALSSTRVSGLAITGEILIDYGILTTPFTPNASPQQQQTSPTNATPTTPADPGGGLPSSSSDDSERVKTMEIVQKVFHYISLVIAGIFFIEVLDMLIVLAAVMVEVAFEIEDRIPELEAATYIVVFRLWRLPQACNIKAKSVQRTLEQDIEVWKAGKTKLEEKCASLEAKHNKQKPSVRLF